MNDIKDMTNYNAEYHANGQLVWKLIGGKTGAKGHRKKKTFHKINLNKINLPDLVVVNEEILKKSREQYAVSHQMIPVFLSYDFRLIAGYEQYVLAKELGKKEIPFQRKKMTKSEERKFSHHPSDAPVGNKKYKLVTVDGKTEYVSALQQKRFRQINGRLRKMGLYAQYIGDHNIRFMNKSGECVKKRKALGSAMKFLNTHIYQDDKFVTF